MNTDNCLKVRSWMSNKNLRALVQQRSQSAAATSVVSAPPSVYKPRLGEGVGVDITSTRNVVVGGVPQITVTFDLGKTEVPSRKFYSNALQVLEDDGVFHLCFGQKRLFNGNAKNVVLRSLIDVVMTEEAIRNLLFIVKDLDFDAGRKIGLSNFTEEPSQTLPLNANFVATSVGKDESCLDFYQGSGFELAAVAAGQPRLHLDPVVRLFLPSALLRSMILDLRKRSPANQEKSAMEV